MSKMDEAIEQWRKHREELDAMGIVGTHTDCGGYIMEQFAVGDTMYAKCDCGQWFCKTSWHPCDPPKEVEKK
jgi:hypothetical protein